jgi:hypothetical protein
MTGFEQFLTATFKKTTKKEAYYKMGSLGRMENRECRT